MRDRTYSINESAALINGVDKKNFMSETAVGKTLLYAANNLLLSFYLTGTNKLLTSESGASSAALVSTIQAIINGTCVGFLLATGINIGKPIGEKKYSLAGNIAKSSWALTFALSLIASGIMLSMRGVLPLFFDEPVARPVIDYFAAYSIGIFPSFMMITNPQIAFLAGDWYIPPIAGAANYLPSVLFSYLLGSRAGMGAFGVGLGASIAAWGSAIAMQLWFSRNKYQDYKLYNFPIQDFKSQVREAMKEGWKMSLQRLTEWGNLFVITFILGLWSSNNLAAVNPAIQWTIILSFLSQGTSHATGMLVRNKKGEVEKLKDERDYQAIKGKQKETGRMLIGNTFASSIINIVAGIILYLARKPLTSFFLSSEASVATVKMAEKILWLSGITLLPDSIRIVTSGALRGWKDILMPTLVSLVSMTLIGVPISSVISSKLEEKNPLVLFWGRAIAVTAAAGVISGRLFQQYKKDSNKVNNLLKGSIFSTLDESTDLDTENESNEEVDFSISASSV